MQQEQMPDAQDRQAAGWIAPLPYEDLVAANRRGAMDRQSARLLAAELVYLERWRRTSGAGRALDDIAGSLAGIALSGGGIRSATFALGVTQALAAQDQLRRFDYLSTVSGGGYLGSSLTWLTRPGNPAGHSFSRQGFPYPVDPPAQQLQRLARPEQDEQLIYLRQHGKYLMPGRGIDLLSGLAVVLRGFLLNLLVWLPILVCFLLALRAPLPVLSINGYQALAWAAGLGVLLFAAVSLVYSFFTKGSGLRPERYAQRRMFETNVRYLLWLTLLAAALALLPPLHGVAAQLHYSGALLSLGGGLASAALTFFKARANGNPHAASLTFVPVAGALLLLYALLVFGYGWADQVYRGLLEQNPWPLYGSGLLLLLALASGYCVNVNLISVHRYYRDRLMEAFLPDPPAPGGEGFSDLATLADMQKVQDFDGRAEAPSGPYQLINTNVILVNSREPNWKLRGGDSFILSPLLCGSNATGWCSTGSFLDGNLTLPTAMAISGAAANPYAGGSLYRNRSVALLMSLFNLRLGYWVTHPDPARRRHKSRNHFTTAWRELSGKLDETRPLLQLSDGGHFENLGLYELIRRRARVILACDGTADPEFGFGDFIKLLARIEADFGARIVFADDAGFGNFMPSTPAGYPKDTQLAQRGFTSGTVHYADGSTGDLIYVTTTLFQGLGLRTLGYKAANLHFPDETTADQFFDEAQFEAYRDLGYHVATTMLADPRCAAILREGLRAQRREEADSSLGAS